MAGSKQAQQHAQVQAQVRVLGCCPLPAERGTGTLCRWRRWRRASRRRPLGSSMTATRRSRSRCPGCLRWDGARTSAGASATAALGGRAAAGGIVRTRSNASSSLQGAVKHVGRGCCNTFEGAVANASRSAAPLAQRCLSPPARPLLLPASWRCCWRRVGGRQQPQHAARTPSCWWWWWCCRCHQEQHRHR